MAVFELDKGACLEGLLNANSGGRKRVRSDKHRWQNVCCFPAAPLCAIKVSEIKPE